MRMDVTGGRRKPWQARDAVHRNLLYTGPFPQALLPRLSIVARLDCNTVARALAYDWPALAVPAHDAG